MPSQVIENKNLLEFHPIPSWDKVCATGQLCYIEKVHGVPYRCAFLEN